MEEIVIQPEKIRALIVGIEEYPRMGEDYRLANATREAREFAEWLFDLGAAAKDVRLFASESGAFDGLTDRYDVPLRPSPPAGIRDALLVPPFADLSEGGLLFVYWAGHGNIDTSLHQVLWDGNYHRDHDRLVFDLEDVQCALRSERWKAFPRQILVVNACANDSGRDFNYHPFGDLPFENQLARRQFTICAASPGQYAREGDANAPSPFFKQLLTTMREQTRSGRPLRLDDACNRICAAMETAPQTPRIEWINWNGSRFVCSDDALSRLVCNTLRTSRIDFDHLIPLYRQCVGDEEPVKDVREIVARLEGEKRSDRKLPTTTSRGPVLDFALRVIHCLNLDELNRELSKYFETPENGEDMTLLVKARRMIGEEYRVPEPPFFLSIIPGDAEDTFTLYLHDGSGRELFHEDLRVEADETLEAAFHRVVHERRAVLAKCVEQLQYHFFLRLEKLSFKLHDWKDPTRPGGRRLFEHHHRVVVRSLERAKPAAGWEFVAEAWRNKTEKIKRRSQPRLRTNWIDPRGGGDYADAATDHECIGFHSPPPSVELREALMEGLPYLIWPRGESAFGASCRESLDAIPTSDSIDRALEEFPRIRRSHPDAPFAVFWDDPDRNPYKTSHDPADRAHAQFVDIA